LNKGKPAGKTFPELHEAIVIVEYNTYFTISDDPSPDVCSVDQISL
jgi:hypothetical protein